MVTSIRWGVLSLSSIINVFMPMSVMGFCDFYQEMVQDQRYYVYNNEYPDYYYAGTTCKWVAQSPPNTHIEVSCEDVHIPPLANCSGDRLSISLTGNELFQDAHNYCGTGTLSIVSTTNKVAVGLFAARDSTGGRFLCTVTASKPVSNCTCGWSGQTRIVGGQEASINEFPAMAGLVDLLQRNLFCGATIIANRYALTAAHCMQNKVPSNIGLLVGDHNIELGTDTNAAALYVLEQVTTHQYYNEQTKVNDIALVKTKDDMTFSTKVGPICLPFRYSVYDFSYETVTALGWGTMEFSGPTSDTLQKVNLTVISNVECRYSMAPEVIINEQLCTYSKGKDACQFDSGGPLLWKDPTTHKLQLLGLVSYGIGCAGSKPAVNTRVNSYLTWIVENTPDTQYCIK